LVTGNRLWITEIKRNYNFILLSDKKTLIPVKAFVIKDSKASSPLERRWEVRSYEASV